MSFWDRFRRPKNEEKPLPKLSDDSAWANYLLGRGYSISSEDALKVAAVFRCVDLVSKTMASLPIHLFEHAENGKVMKRDHPVFNLLYVLPNRYTTAYEMFQMFVTNLLLTRGAFLKIVRNRRGQISELWNIPTCAVSGPYLTDDDCYIIVSNNEETETLYDGQFVYVPSFRFTSVKDPMDPIQIAADVLGLNDSMTRFAEAGFNGANPGGFVEHPGAMSDKAYERFKTSFRENYEGVQNSGKWLILEEGMKAQPWNRNMETSQLLESRKWAVTEVCRIFGVPPHLCMDMEHATFSNIEQQSMEFVRDCINPLCVRLEQTFYKDLLLKNEQKTLFFKFNLNGLMRGDSASRTVYYHNARQDGWMSANDIRSLEDMNPIPAEMGGDVYAVNGNMIPLAAVPLNLPKGVMQANGQK